MAFACEQWLVCQINQRECRMKSKFITVILLVIFIATVSSTPVHSQLGGEYTCGQFQRLDAGTRGFPAFVPFGFENDTNHWWVIQTLDGNLLITSTGEAIDPIDNYGRNIRIWNPSFNSGGGLISVNSYQFVGTCVPETLDITLTADQTNLTQGQCTTLRESIPEGWSFAQTLNGTWQANGYGGGASIRDSKEVCPAITTTYSISATYNDGAKKASITITVSVPPPPPATCQDSAATNFGQVGDCTYPPPATCQDSAATNFGQVGDCTYPPPATCQDSAATNFGQVGDCTYRPTTQNSILELSVNPVNQREVLITLSDGQIDNGDYDCFIASMSMALEYFKSQNILNDQDTTSFLDLVPIVRGTKDPGEGISNDPSFVSRVTNNKLTAKAWYTKPENLAEAIERELKDNRPVVISVPKMNLLAAQLSGTGHSVLVYGLHDGRVYYVDPWNGRRYDMSIQDFVNADTHPDGSFLITFERLQQ
jgi:uncharacterized protein YvpB